MGLGMRADAGELEDGELYPGDAAQARLRLEREALMRGEGVPLITPALTTNPLTPDLPVGPAVAAKPETGKASVPTKPL